MRGAGFGVLIGLLGVLPACGWACAAELPAAVSQARPVLGLSQDKENAEPPRVRAARRFLARRGIRAGSAVSVHAQRAQVRPGGVGHASTNLNVAQPLVTGTPIWTAAGPVGVNSLAFGLVTGRVSAITFDPSDVTGNHVFVGTTGGGLWQSQNAAASTASSVQFLPLTDDLGALIGAAEAGISVGAVSVQPGGTGVVLAGLGDPNDALDSYYGAGLLRSADGGQTWTPIKQTMDFEDGLGAQDFSFLGEGFAGFAWSTKNVQLVVAAVSQAYEGTLVNAGQNSLSYEGLYWSNDGGVTWHLARITDLNGADVQGPFDGFALPDGNAVTSVVWNPIRQVFVAAVRYHGYYQSADGMNWTQLPFYPSGQPGAGFTAQNCPTQSGSVGVEGCPIFRGSLAVNPLTGDTFAWSVDAFNQDQGIWQDQCSVTGFGASASCSNASLTFGVPLGTAALESTSGYGPATIANGDYNLTLAAVPAGQDTLIFAGDSCTVQVIFTPAAVGAMTATLTVSTATLGVAPATAALTGTGLSLPMLGISPTAVNMGSVLLGNTSATYTVQITNTGQIAMNQPSFALSGIAGPSGAQLTDFALSAPTDITACTSSLNPGSACNIQMTFSPSVAGTESATMTITASNASPTTATVSLNGVGMAPLVLQPGVASLDFPATAVGTTSAPLTLALNNLSSETGNNLALSVSGPYAMTPALTTCTTKLLSNSSCTVGLSFTPTASGNQPGALTATVSNLGVPPLVISLDGSGTAVGGIQVNPTQMTFGSVAVHTASAVQTLTVTNSGAAALTGLVVSATGDFALTGNPCPATLNAGVSCTIGVQLTPSMTGIENGTLTVNSSSTGVPPAVVPLTGNGIPAGSIVANPAVLSFGTVSVGQTSPAQTVTVSNDGATTLAGLTYQLSGDYSLAHNGCGTQLASGTMCSITVTFSPSAPGTRIGALTVQSTATGFTPLVVGLTGTGLPTVQLVVTPLQVAFGSVALGSNSAISQLTLSNPGTGTLQGLSLTTVAPFSVGDGSCGASILPGGSCQAPVVFAPTVAGSQSGTVTITTTSLGVAPVAVALSGSGLAGASLSVSPAIVTFPGAAIGVLSAGQTLTISNPGGTALSGLSVSLSGAADFAIASTSCTTTLSAGGSCSAVVTFDPSVAGGRQGILTASSTTKGVANAMAVLNGTGETSAALAITPAQVTFAATMVGQISATQTVTVANIGQAGITNLQLAVTAGFYLDPAKTTCTAVLNGGASCQAGVLFAPTVGGTINGSITASSALTSGSIAATTPLTGVGALPAGIVSLPAALVQFGTTGLGQAATPVQVTLTNQGTLTALTGFTVAINSAGLANGFGLSNSTCGATLAAGASCIVNVTFTPVVYGPLTGTLAVGSANGGNAVNLQLEGVGFDFRLAITGSNAAAVTPGQTGTYTLALTALGGSTGGAASKFSFACGSLPANTVCVFNPIQLTVPTNNVTGDTQLGISTEAPTSASGDAMQNLRGGVLLACAVFMLPFGLRQRKSRKRKRWMLGILLLGFASGLCSCAGSGGSSGSGGSEGQSHLGGGTPPGSYMVTVTASANSVIHSITVTLTVN